MLLFVAVFWVGSLAFHQIHSIGFLLESGDPGAELLLTSPLSLLFSWRMGCVVAEFWAFLTLTLSPTGDNCRVISKICHDYQ